MTSSTFTGWWDDDQAIYDEEIGLTVTDTGETWIETDAHDLPPFEVPDVG